MVQNFVNSLTDMKNLDQIIKEIKENTYDNDLAEIYKRELLDKEKKYD